MNSIFLFKGYTRVAYTCCWRSLFGTTGSFIEDVFDEEPESKTKNIKNNLCNENYNQNIKSSNTQILDISLCVTPATEVSTPVPSPLSHIHESCNSSFGSSVPKTWF